ncbi:MAG TPA: SGNH/GDSL hydrolase family protein [Bdellovibrionota bacterium]|jgi:hypothetical protein
MWLLILTCIFPFASAHAWEKTLFLGDSHSFFQEKTERRLGAVLIRTLPELIFFSACGSAPQTWLEGGNTNCGFRALVPGKQDEMRIESAVPKLSDLLAQHQPKRIWIELGDNLFDWDKSRSPALSTLALPRVKKQLRAFISFLSSSAWRSLKCVWAGPAKGGKGTRYEKTDAALAQLYKALESEVAKRCRLIDSRTLVDHYDGGDGLHFGPEGSVRWGETLAREFDPPWGDPPAGK